MLDAKPTGPARAVKASFSTRPDGNGVARTRVLVSGVHAKDLDFTGNITAAIAHALWQARGGDASKNWAEAERLVEQLAAGSPRTPSLTEPPRPAAADSRPRDVREETVAPLGRRGSR